MPVERDDVEEYLLVRRAVRDALWDVLGSVLVLVLAWAVFVVGASTVVSGLSNAAWPTLPTAFGLVLMAGAVVLCMRELGVPPFD